MIVANASSAMPIDRRARWNTSDVLPSSIMLFGPRRAAWNSTRRERPPWRLRPQKLIVIEGRAATAIDRVFGEAQEAEAAVDAVRVAVEALERAHVRVAFAGATAAK